MPSPQNLWMFNCPIVDEEEWKKQAQSCEIIKFNNSEAEGVLILPYKADLTLSPQTLKRDEE